ncbi:MAG: hypothetical protein AABX25_03585 [Nanoarchaeota archaeon]
MLFSVLLTAVSAAETSDCDYKIEILLNSSVYTPSDFVWKMKAARVSGISTNITATARIEDSNGKIIKTYKPWTSDPISRQKTSGEYSPNLKDGEYRVISEISVDCNDVDKSNNIDSENFAIASAANENPQQDSKEEILITQSPPVISAPEENKSIIQIVENKVNIKNNSDEVNLAQKPIEYSNEITLLNSDGKSDSALQDSSKPELIYESSNEKSKEIVLYVLLGFSVLLNIILIWKR